MQEVLRMVLCRHYVGLKFRFDTFHEKVGSYGSIFVTKLLVTRMFLLNFVPINLLKYRRIGIFKGTVS